MDKWEYTAYIQTGSWSARMADWLRTTNYLGKQGWEVVAISHDSGLNMVIAILKRRWEGHEEEALDATATALPGTD